jgi:hypothetical protein
MVCVCAGLVELPYQCDDQEKCVDSCHHTYGTVVLPHRQHFGLESR